MAVRQPTVTAHTMQNPQKDSPLPYIQTEIIRYRQPKEINL